MRLLRVQVPDFRALKNVDISFEPEFTPQVFPLGSLNGGGKSTLLQLVYTLFNFLDHSFLEPDSLLKNLLDNFTIPERSHKRIIAIIDVLYDNQKIQLEFFCANEAYLESFPFKEDKVLSSDLTFTTIDNISFELLNTGGTEIEHYLTLYFDDNNLCYLGEISKNMGMFCKIKNNLRGQDTFGTLCHVSGKVFLISPSNQSYIFLSKKERRLLFTSDNEKSYKQVLEGLKKSSENFFTYDFIDILAEVFRLARDKDYDERNKNGKYGTYSEELETAINNIFIDGKKIVPLTVKQKRHTKDSIQSISFKLPSGVEIYPEDLSHGELKRLTIFILLKYHNIQDSIVLFDEIENGFHPDWQYEIVRDLLEWGKDNQYILATHSYELCTAVTPSHVKELEPQLIKNA